MFDIGGWEFLLIVIIGVLVIGPKELPGVLRTVNALKRRARELARDFQDGLEEIAREAELDKMGDEVKELADPSGDLRNQIENTIDPHGEIRDAMDFDTEWRDDDLADSGSAGEVEAENNISPLNQGIDVEKALAAQEAEKAPDPVPTPAAPAEPVALAEAEEVERAEKSGDEAASDDEAPDRKPGAS